MPSTALACLVSDLLLTERGNNLFGIIMSPTFKKAAHMGYSMVIK